MATFTVTVSENLGGETPALENPYRYTLSAENLGESDSVSRAADLHIPTVTDNLGAADSVSVVAIFSVVVTENLGGAESVTATGPVATIYTVSVVDNLGGADTQSRTVIASRTLSDFLGGADSVARAADLLMALVSDNLGAADVVLVPDTGVPSPYLPARILESESFPLIIHSEDSYSAVILTADDLRSRINESN